MNGQPANGFATPIFLGTPASRRCLISTCILHGFAAVVCTSVAFEPRMLVLIYCMLATSFWITFSAYRNTSGYLQSALLLADNQWVLLTKDLEVVSASFTGAPFVTRSLMIFRLRDQTGKKWFFYITTDNASPTMRRRLFVRLRFLH
ncbi:MAG: protein YgfX [Pseudomonadota bacterium]